MQTLAIIKQLQAEDIKLKSSDIKTITGLTYRKLNDWEKKGIIPSDRKVKEGWRYFTPSEAFAIAVCAELRKRMDLSFNKLKWICKRLLEIQAEGPKLIFCLQRIAQYGGNVCIFTDSRRMQVVDLESIVKQYIAAGKLVEAEEIDDFIFMKLNQIINKLLSTIFNQKIEIKSDPELYKNHLKTDLKIINELNLLKPEEKALIVLIRSGNYPRFSLRTKDGRLLETKMIIEQTVEPEKLGIIIKNKELQNIKLERLTDGNFKLVGEKVYRHKTEK